MGRARAQDRPARLAGAHDERPACACRRPARRSRRGSDPPPSPAPHEQSRADRPARAARQGWPRCGQPATRTRPGYALEPLIDGEQALPRIAAAIEGRARTCTSRAGTSHPTSGSLATSDSSRLRELLGEPARAGRCEGAAVGRARRCRCSPRARAVRADPRRARARDARALRARSARAPDALPSREARDRRRRGRLRRRHRLDLTGRRPLRHERPPAAWPAWLARRLDAAARPGGRRRRRHFAARWRRSPTRRLRRRRSRRRGRRTRCRCVRTVPERVYASSRRATSASSRPTSARCARRAG